MDAPTKIWIGGTGGRLRPLGLSQRAAILVLVGAVGVLVSAGLAVALILHVMPVSAFVAALIYLAGVVAVSLVTAGRIGGWGALALRLLLPLPGALLVWWILGLFGL